jgi:pyruvate kinase
MDVFREISKHARRKTKIIATVGPASRSTEKIRALIDAGVNVFRLNFSHGSHAEHLETLHTIRAVANEMQSYTAILQDLAGPKIRITNITEDYTTLNDNEKVELRFAKDANSVSTAKFIYVEGVDPSKVLIPGQPILLADGIISLECIEVKNEAAVCTVVKGSRLRSRVGIAFPDSAINLPATTAKDMEDLKWGIQNGVDYAAISFVQNAEDVRNIREAINKAGADIKIIAKVERKAALENIHEIIEASDSIMVARGDLGLEFPLEQLPMIQKKIIEEANHSGKAVIVATQMLHSMITAVRPTRAEVSDIAAAVMSGADAVMLSEETAIGEHPVESVNYLSRIAMEAEKIFEYEEYKLRLRDSDHQTVPDAVSYAACAAAVKVNASAIIACTETGNSVRLIAKYRPQQPLYGVSTKEAALRRMSLIWGVIPIHCKSSSNHYDEIEVALKTVQQNEQFPNGSRAVITGGTAVSTPGSTSIMEIREMLYLK